MRKINGKTLKDFELTGLAKMQRDILIRNGLEEKFIKLIKEYFPNGISDNDLIKILAMLGLDE